MRRIYSCFGKKLLAEVETKIEAKLLLKKQKSIKAKVVMHKTVSRKVL